ncbi:MAG: multicopper oxidase domain-containing protein [Acidimicrobiia bacterium]|nr:multicopper oxidase domain-containing protein [Acidimicrobiia bacterium]
MPNEATDPWPGLIRLGILALMGVLALWAVFTIVQGDTASASGASDGPGAATIRTSEFAFGGQLTLPAGDVVLTVVNEGNVEHDLSLRSGGGTGLIRPGESATLELTDLAPEAFDVFCSVPGHEAAGMIATLQVTSDSVEAVDEHGTEADWEELDRAMQESILRFPAATEGIGNEPLEPVILADGTKEFELTAEIVPWEVEPGKFVEAWTYNGMVPGPMIELDLGDKVRVVVHNKLPMGTDVHWHGVDTPNNMDGVAPLTQPLILSGEDFVYEFVADAPAIGMYHSHHHGQMQVPNGMFGVIKIGETPIPAGQTVGGVEIPEDIEIAGELPMVLNDAGVIGYSLNGKSFPATQPYVYDKGDWVVAHYYNEGLQIHPMHLHQFGQLVIAKDGFPLDNPYWADTINVAPGERYSVLVNLEDPGVWVWHCHILTHVEREEGMFGMVTAIIVNE